jgi:hypothetical protein
MAIDNMTYSNFFWLHIKKSAGITTRKLLSPYYQEVDRILKPPNFIQSPFEHHNDILNNYRVPLGDYQFKRCLFAKQFLYKDNWDNTLSFAFSREPQSRCVSMFNYLHDYAWHGVWTGDQQKYNFKSNYKHLLKYGKSKISKAYAFDLFLENVEAAQISRSIYNPLGLHFYTHTATVWDDVTDLEGLVIIKKIFRLENLIEGINSVFDACNIEKKIEKSMSLNKTAYKSIYIPNKAQVAKIQRLYAKDFELYETAE